MTQNNKPTRKELRRRIKELIPSSGKKAIKWIERLVRPYLEINLNYNSVHDEGSYFYQLLYTALKKYSAEGSSKVLNMDFDAPSPDQMLRVFHYDTRTLNAMRDIMLEETTSTAKRFGAFKAPTDIAIDFFDIPYYGDRNSLNVIGTKRKAGTNYAHSFGCCDVIVKGERFCAGFLPRTMLTEDVELAENLIKTALAHVSVRIALLDREFFQVAVIKLLLRNSLFFIIPAADTEEIKRLKDANRHRLPCIVDYTMRSKNDEITVKLVLVEREKDNEKCIYGFITNLDWEADDIAEYYRSRWGTETNNRKRNEFRAMTTSQRYELRYLYYMISVALHNIWILVNLMLAYEVYRIHTKPLVETYLMKELVLSEIAGG